MRKLIQIIKAFFQKWKDKKIVEKGIETLGTAVKNQQKERLKLRYDITQLIIKYAKLDKDNKSKYIPLDAKTKMEIRNQVELKYGEDMKRLNVKMNKNLQVV